MRFGSKVVVGLCYEIEGDSIFKVEARDMLEGLFLALDKGFRRIEVESDNALLIALLQSGGGSKSNLVKVRLLHQMLNRD